MPTGLHYLLQICNSKHNREYLGHWCRKRHHGSLQPLLSQLGRAAAAELDLEQIWNLVDELIEAHGDWLPEYA